MELMEILCIFTYLCNCRLRILYTVIHCELNTEENWVPFIIPTFLLFYIATN